MVKKEYKFSEFTKETVLNLLKSKINVSKAILLEYKINRNDLSKIKKELREKGIKISKRLENKIESIQKDIIKTEQKEKIKEIEEIEDIEEIKEEKVKNIKNQIKCNFNYETRNNLGYIINKNVDLYINSDTSDSEHYNNLEEILSIIDNYYDFKCPQRQNYITLEYKIFFEGKENEYSSITTNISLNLDNLKNRVIDNYNMLVELINRGASPAAILIYNIIYVNYEFKSGLI